MQTKADIVLTPIAPGELIDKITVLNIKKERLSDPAHLVNVNRELEMLEEVRNKNFLHDAGTKKQLEELENSLKKVNEIIWDVSEDLRRFMEENDFGPEFIEVSCAIHINNDERAKLKKEINLLLGSAIIEEKSYKHWK